MPEMGSKASACSNGARLIIFAAGIFQLLF